MSTFKSWIYPELPPEISELLQKSNDNIVVVGVIGKSAFPDCNKLSTFNLLHRLPALLDHTPKEGQIQFYYKPNDPMLILHFETTRDAYCMQQMLQEELAKTHPLESFSLFQQRLRSRFARMLLFAIHVCHIIVLVELSVAFDSSLLPLMRSLKLIRERHILKFLPKFLKNSSVSTVLGKTARLCSPRFLFLFENCPSGYDKSKESISKLEFDMEDDIYQRLRSEFIITNNSSTSLFSIPNNKRFAYFNIDENLREDPLEKCMYIFETLLEKTNFKDDEEDLNELLPFKGFAKPLEDFDWDINPQTPDEVFLKEHRFSSLLKAHIDEALTTGFDDSSSKQKNRSHFELVSAKVWYDIFETLHKIFITNPDNPEFQTNDPDYKSYLDNFEGMINYDQKYFNKLCALGLDKAYARYVDPTITNYSTDTHKKMVNDAITLYYKYARGPHAATNEQKLQNLCTQYWMNGKQQCEQPSLRGNFCMLPKTLSHEGAEHSSGQVFISTCNCGRTQGRREDPYTIRQANYEFYEFMASNCNLCVKVLKVKFAVFEPSVSDYRAAEFEVAFPKLIKHSEPTPLSSDEALVSRIDCSQPLTASLGTNLSLRSDVFNKIVAEFIDPDEDSATTNSDRDSCTNELVLKIKDKSDQSIEGDTENDKLSMMNRQASTTEYLPSMVHTQSPLGLLPQFPSWSLVCVGSSSVYSHSTGLMEHFQTGFLSGSNFLLPWDVHVRLEHASTWAGSSEKPRYRKLGELIVLKVFVGFEYECPRGHRFMMSSNNHVLRGAGDIQRDTGSKAVHSNMPLYFPCPCRSQPSDVAQLMRVHVVTPKAPVNVIVEPKVRTGEQKYIFTMGMLSSPKLSQSAYWILRLPYVYQGNELSIAPPKQVNSANAAQYGCLLGGMFGVTETEGDE